MAPLLNASLKAIKYANKAAKIGTMLGVPSIPDDVVAYAEEKLDKMSTGQEHACIQAAMEDASVTGKGEQHRLSGFSLNEFKEFLKKEDPQEGWKGSLFLVDVSKETDDG